MNRNGGIGIVGVIVIVVVILWLVDVISGPIGSASLRDPATAGIEGADLALLPTVAAADPGSNTPIDEPRPSQA